MKTLVDIATDMVVESALWADKQLPFTASLTPGHPKAMLVAGENAAGKSFFVECLRSWARHFHERDTIQVSIRERSGGGLYELSSFRRAVMFGDETEQSTGATSVNATEKAFTTLAGRAEEGKSSLLVLDEPELGLSDGYAKALGEYIGLEILKLPALTCGVVVVTHNRGLARGMALALEESPSFVKLGLPQEFKQWLDAPEHHTVSELLALAETNLKHWRTVSKVLEGTKKR